MNLGLVSEFFTPERILDIGANIGQFHQLAKHTFPSAYVHSVEAMPACQPFLESLTTEYTIAMLGKDNSTHSFYVNKTNAVSTGNSMYRELTDHFRDDNLEVIEMECKRLDDLFSHTHFDLIKLDTQGSELDILSGGENLMKKARGIILEIALKPYNQDAPLVDEVLAFMKSHGFEPVKTLEEHVIDEEVKQIDYLFMKSVKIYDCFTFWNEKEILEMRLKHLWDHVDKFVIAESNVTHRGNPKEWNLEKLLDGELSWAKSKIVYIKKEIDVSNLNLNYTGDIYNPFSPFWIIENTQRNAIVEGLKEASPDDIIMIGDLDEFPNLHVFSQIAYITDVCYVFALGMRIFGYYMNVEISDYPNGLWKGTVVGRMKNLTTPQEWRHLRTCIQWEGNLGYHFSWVGKDAAKDKVKNTAHDEIRSTDMDKIFVPDSDGNFTHFVDPSLPFYRQVIVDADIFYPQSVLDSRSKYPHLFYDSNSPSS
jgi:FkbM family methyltransferase